MKGDDDDDDESAAAAALYPVRRLRIIKQKLNETRTESTECVYWEKIYTN